MSKMDLAPPLLGTEHIGPKGWIRQFLCFELPDGYDIDHMTQLLKNAFKSLKAKTPIAGCKMVPLANGPRPGMWQLVPYDQNDHDDEFDFTVKDLRDDFVTFAEFREKDYPVSLLTPQKMAMRGLGGEWPRPEDMQRGFNTLWMQANFIKSGLLLNLLVFHSQADAPSCYMFAKILAEELRRGQGLEINDPIDLHALVADRRALGAPEIASTEVKMEEYPEYIVLPFVPEGPPPKLMSPIHHGHIFHFTPDAIERLKKDCWPTEENLRLGHKEEKPSFISTNDALNALVWKVVIDVQHPDLDTLDEPERPSMLSIALDLRRRAGVHRFTLGNHLGWAASLLDAKTLVKETTLADLALMIRQSLTQRADRSYTEAHASMIDAQRNMGKLAPLVFLDVPGRNTLISSWRDSCPFYEIEWGPALGERIRAVRMPSVGICHGFQVVLPDRPDKPGVEINVGVENGAMERLLSHPLWNKYATNPKHI